MEWLMNNWLIVIPVVIACASIIVKATPNKTDNKILEKVIKVFEALSLNTPPVNK